MNTDFFNRQDAMVAKTGDLKPEPAEIFNDQWAKRKANTIFNHETHEIHKRLPNPSIQPEVNVEI